MNSLKTEFHANKNAVPTLQKNNTIFIIKANQLIPFREIIPACSEKRTKHISTLCGENVAFCVAARSGRFLLGFKRSSNVQ
jgi:hypothetical protein